MKATAVQSTYDIPRSTELEQMQFRVSLLRLTGQTTESLEEILTSLQPAP